MQIFLSCGTTAEIEKEFIQRGYSRLFSQYNDRSQIKRYISLGGKDLLLDSGAYSAYNSGKVIDIDDYIEYANSITKYCKFIVALDVIGGDPQDSYDNYVYMKERLIEPQKLMPVYHDGEDIKWLHRYLNEGSKCIGLGGLVGIDPNNFLTVCGMELSKYKDVWVHAFGITNVRTLSRHTFLTSADSGAWVSGTGRYYAMMPSTYECAYVGRGRYTGGRRERPVPIEQFTGENVHPNIIKAFDELGITAEDLYQSHNARARLSAYSLNEWAKNVVTPEVTKRSLL